MPPSGGRATARAIPGARLLVIEGMGHDIPRAAWPRMLDAIEQNAARAGEPVPPCAEPGGEGDALARSRTRPSSRSARTGRSCWRRSARNQVVVVAGETGSGKTTQLPKLCLELGRERIAHTQPRRLAARTVAARIAEEMKVPLGETVGYAVRFRDRSSARHAGAADDRRPAAGRDPARQAARRYDTIIVDEAHERVAEHRLPARLPARACCRGGPT